MLRLHPAFYLAATLLGLGLGYWGIESILRGGEEVRGVLSFWVAIDAILTIAAAGLALASFLNRPQGEAGDSLTGFRPSRVPAASAGASQHTRRDVDWSRHGEIPQRSAGRDPLGRRS